MHPAISCAAATSLLLATLARPLAASAASTSPSGASSPAGLHDRVRRAKKELELRDSHASYHQSPYNPKSIVESIHLLENERSWAALCQELAQLPDDELELFENEIRKADHLPHLRCAPELLSRIDRHWKEAARQFTSSHPREEAGERKAMEVVVVPVDVTQAAALRDGALPEGTIALTFDDGPHATRTERVMKILADAGVRATFFEIGKNAAAWPMVARQVRAAGHTVGSHTFSHADLPKLAESHAETEIEAGNASVALALGIPPQDLPFFRFPYGAKTPKEQAFVAREGKSTFFWNMDSEDWKIRDPHKLFLNVLREIDRARGGIILFHDIHEQTVIVLPSVLAELRARNIKTAVFVPAEGAPRSP